MEVFYNGRKNRTKAAGDYDINSGALTVKKGSIVSETVAEYKNTSAIQSLRKEYTDENGVLLKDLKFNSASAAASFVAGYSASGMVAWHVDKHIRLKDALQK